MNLRRLYFISILFFLSCEPSSEDNCPIATVGNRKITIAEFKDRVSFNPIIGNISISRHKENILNSIIAEVLLSQSESAPLSEHISLLTNQKNREAVIEKFWEEIVFKDIEVNDQTLWSFYLNLNKQRELEFVIFKDIINATNFYTEWNKNNLELDNLFQKDTIGFTGNIAILEKEVFNAELSKVSKPLKIGRKYLVYRPTKEWQIGPLNKQDYYQRFKSIKKQYLKLTKQEHFFAYFKRTFKKQNYQLDKNLFKKLTKYLIIKLMNKPEIKGINREILDFTTLGNGLEPGMTLVRFDHGEDWTIMEFLKHFAVAPYPLNYSSNGAFRFSLIKATKRTLDDELLYRKALEYNLDESDFVKWQTNMWRDFYSAQKTVSDKKYSLNKIKKTLNSLKKKIPINIKWNVVDTLTISATNMMVLKTHFPGQTIVPKQEIWDLNLKRK